MYLGHLLQEYEQKTPGDFKTAIQTLSHEIHDEESGEDSGHLGDGLDDDTLGSDEKEGSDDEMDNHSERNYGEFEFITPLCYMNTRHAFPGDKNDGINEAQEEEEKSDKSAKIGEEEVRFDTLKYEYQCFHQFGFIFRKMEMAMTSQRYQPYPKRMDTGSPQQPPSPISLSF